MLFYLRVAMLLLCAMVFMDDSYAQVKPSAATVGGRRIALVIGNSSYKELPLPNAVGDAHAVAERLGQLGFTVHEYRDLSKEKMLAVYRQYTQDIFDNDTIGVFYFAGHGMQFDGTTFLVPIDASTSNRREASFWAFPLEPMITVFEKLGNRANIILIDACRKNTFGRTDANQFGLAKPQLSALRNTLVQFATEPGNTAQDGAQTKHSPYTAALLTALAAPETDIATMLQRISASVNAETGGQQVPWAVGTLRQETYLNGSGAPVALAEGGGTTNRPGPGDGKAPSATPQPGVASAGAGLIKYLGTDRGGARFAKIREFLSSDFGNQPITGDELAKIVDGLSGPQLGSMVFSLSQLLDKPLTATNYTTIARLAQGEQKLSICSILRAHLNSQIDVAQALLILDGEVGRSRQSILLSLQRELPSKVGVADLVRLLGEPDADTRITLDAFIPQLGGLSSMDVGALAALVPVERRPAFRAQLLTKLSGPLPLPDAIAVLGGESGYGRERLLRIVIPHLEGGITAQQADALLGDVDLRAYPDLGTALATRLSPDASPEERARLSGTPMPRTTEDATPPAPQKKKRKEASAKPNVVVPPKPPVESPFASFNRAPADEQLPPVGENLIFAEPQVRYCMYERQRILILKGLLVDKGERDAALLGRRVADFNSRCGKYRYVRGVDAKIATEMTTRQDAFQREATAIWEANQ